MNRIFYISLISFSVLIFHTFILPQYEKTRHTRTLLNQVDQIRTSFFAVEEKKDLVDRMYDSLTDGDIKRITFALPDVNNQAEPLSFIDITRFLEQYYMSGNELTEEEKQNLQESPPPITPLFTHGPLTAVEGGIYKQMDVVISGSGTYGEVRDLLDGLSQWGKAFYITDVSISRKIEREEEKMYSRPFLNVTIAATLFFLESLNDTVDSI